MCDIWWQAAQMFAMSVSFWRFKTTPEAVCRQGGFVMEPATGSGCFCHEGTLERLGPSLFERGLTLDLGR